MRPLSIAASLALMISTSYAGGDSAPSSHMVYSDASFDGDIIINEVRVPEDGEAMYTYYEALGWGGKAGGYAGIQAHPKARNYIFSIWDHKDHTAPIKATHHGPGTLTQKFGGEGTGLKSWNFELGWDTDVWYTLVARCWPVGDHTFYGYWVRSEKSRRWTHMVTMDVAVKGAYFRGGNDSFIEDWLSTGKNARTAHLRKGWKRKLSGEWHAFGAARYSVNSWDLEEGKRSFNFRTNWDGGVAKDDTGEFYYMTSGGAETKPTSKNPSEHAIKRSEKKPGYLPIKITSAESAAGADGKISVSWEIDPQSAPQFAYSIAVHANAEGKGDPLLMLNKIEPHSRGAEIELPAGVDRKAPHLRLQCRDLFDNQSAPIVVKEG